MTTTYRPAVGDLVRVRHCGRFIGRVKSLRDGCAAVHWIDPATGQPSGGGNYPGAQDLIPAGDPRQYRRPIGPEHVIVLRDVSEIPAGSFVPGVTAVDVEEDWEARRWDESGHGRHLVFGRCWSGRLDRYVLTLEASTWAGWSNGMGDRDCWEWADAVARHEGRAYVLLAPRSRHGARGVRVEGR